ncbi:LysM domain protein, partial [Snodgrassella alvi SCGC AB-598-O02]
DNNPSVSTPVSTGYVPNYSPVDITAANHTVQRGDTVYNISKRYQITQDNLRSWNNLVDDNIKLGQVLRVKPAGYVATAGTTTTTVTTVTPQVNTPKATTTTTVTNTTTTKSTTTETVKNSSGIDWLRPTAGKILQGFGGSSKGIDFGGNMGQPVVSAAAQSDDKVMEVKILDEAMNYLNNHSSNKHFKPTIFVISYNRQILLLGLVASESDKNQVGRVARAQPAA